MGAGIAQSVSDLLQDRGSGGRIPVETSFPVPVQTCSGAHPTSTTMGTGLVPGGKAAGAWR